MSRCTMVIRFLRFHPVERGNGFRLACEWKMQMGRLYAFETITRNRRLITGSNYSINDVWNRYQSTFRVD